MSARSPRLRRALAALPAAFPHTLPVLAGFGFLGLTYGVFARVQGFGVAYAVITGIAIFGGSLQFVAVSMMMAPFAPLQTFAAALLIQARHLFYGIAMLDAYRDAGRKKPYLIYALCDESFSINCSACPPEGVDRGWFMFWVCLLDQCYWVVASALGAALGGLVSADVKGLDFVMTAMFTVIFLEQCLRRPRPLTPWLGLGVSALCLALFGADGFLLPAMAAMLVLLLALRGRLPEGKGDVP